MLHLPPDSVLVGETFTMLARAQLFTVEGFNQTLKVAAVQLAAAVVSSTQYVTWSSLEWHYSAGTTRPMQVCTPRVGRPNAVYYVAALSSTGQCPIGMHKDIQGVRSNAPRRAQHPWRTA